MDEKHRALPTPRNTTQHREWTLTHQQHGASSKHFASCRKSHAEGDINPLT